MVLDYVLYIDHLPSLPLPRWSLWGCLALWSWTQTMLDQGHPRWAGQSFNFLSLLPYKKRGCNNAQGHPPWAGLSFCDQSFRPFAMLKVYESSSHSCHAKKWKHLDTQQSAVQTEPAGVAKLLLQCSNPKINRQGAFEIQAALYISGGMCEVELI